MADHDQDNLEDHEKLMSTKQGLESLSLYSSSIGRYVKDIYQIYYAILAIFHAFGNERNGGKCLMLTMIKPLDNLFAFESNFGQYIKSRLNCVTITLYFSQSETKKPRYLLPFRN